MYQHDKEQNWYLDLSIGLNGVPVTKAKRHRAEFNSSSVAVLMEWNYKNKESEDRPMVLLPAPESNRNEWSPCQAQSVSALPKFLLDRWELCRVSTHYYKQPISEMLIQYEDWVQIVLLPSSSEAAPDLSTTFQVAPCKGSMQEPERTNPKPSFTHNFCPVGLRSPCGWCQELLGHSFPLCSIHCAQGCATAILIDDHGGSWVHVGSINDCLSQFLHVPGGNWLRVGQFCGKYLETGLHVKIQ